MEIKDKIKARRLQLGLTLEEVAKKVGVAKSTVKKWESGQIESMRQSKVMALSKALQVNPEFIIFENESDFNNNYENPLTNDLSDLTTIDYVIISVCKNLTDKDKTKVIKFATKLLYNSNYKE